MFVFNLLYIHIHNTNKLVYHPSCKKDVLLSGSKYICSQATQSPLGVQKSGHDDWWVKKLDQGVRIV